MYDTYKTLYKTERDKQRFEEANKKQQQDNASEAAKVHRKFQHEENLGALYDQM